VAAKRFCSVKRRELILLHKNNNASCGIVLYLTNNSACAIIAGSLGAATIDLGQHAGEARLGGNQHFDSAEEMDWMPGDENYGKRYLLRVPSDGSPNYAELRSPKMATMLAMRRATKHRDLLAARRCIGVCLNLYFMVYPLPASH
jgi:hypothetical protein